MQGKHLSRTPLLLVGLLALLALSGCFQPAGSGFEQPIFDTQPTFTFPAPEVVVLPTDTPEPLPTLEDLPIQLDTATPVIVAAMPTETPTLFVFPTNPPVDNSAAINALLTPQAVEVAQDFTPEPLNLNPFEITATFIVGQATAQAGLPLTQTAEAIFGQPTQNPLFPTTDPFATATSPAVILPGTDCIHEVQPTDRNLYRISLAYGVTVEQIARASGVTNINLIYVGQQLTIPGCGTTGYRPPPTSIPTFPASGATPFPGGGGRVHIVAQGETLFELSLQYNVPVASIASANGIADINRIFIGQQLVIP
jgi:LysM repeat protein